MAMSPKHPKNKVNATAKPSRGKSDSSSTLATPATPRRQPTQTSKLGEIVAESSGSPFKIFKRLPGWRSDCVNEVTGAGCQPFIEETIGLDNSVPAPIPFLVQLDDDNPISWLGGAIPDPHQDPNSADGQFIDLIRSLAALA